MICECGEKMVYSEEYFVLSDGYEVELMKCKKCGKEKPIKDE